MEGRRAAIGSGTPSPPTPRSARSGSACSRPTVDRAHDRLAEGQIGTTEFRVCGRPHGRHVLDDREVFAGDVDKTTAANLAAVQRPARCTHRRGQRLPRRDDQPSRRSHARDRGRRPQRPVTHTPPASAGLAVADKALPLKCCQDPHLRGGGRCRAPRRDGDRRVAAQIGRRRLPGAASPCVPTRNLGAGARLPGRAHGSDPVTRPVTTRIRVRALRRHTAVQQPEERCTARRASETRLDSTRPERRGTTTRTTTNILDRRT
jgi:hypothetical protein